MLNYCKQLLELDKCFIYSIHDLVSVHFMNKSTKGLKQNIKCKHKPCLSNQTLSELSTNTNTLLNDAFIPIIASAANHQIKHHRQRT